MHSTSAEVQTHCITIDPVVKPHHFSAAHSGGKQISHSTTLLCTTQDSNATDEETTRHDKITRVKSFDHIIPADTYSNLTQTNRSTKGGAEHSRVFSLVQHVHTGPQMMRQGGSSSRRTNSTHSLEKGTSPSFTPSLPKPTSQRTDL